MQVRKAQVADIRAVLALSDQINRQHHQGAPAVFAPPTQSFIDVEEYWLGLMIDPLGAFFVVLHEQKVVGFITGKVTQSRGVSFIQQHKVARVNTIVVSEQAQNQGVGKILMTEFNAWAQAKGAVELRLEVMEFNQNAQSFYESLGMETQSRTMSMSLDAG